MEQLPALLIASAASNVFFSRRFSFGDDSGKLAFLLATLVLLATLELNPWVSLLGAFAVLATQRPNWEGWLNMTTMTTYLLWVFSTESPDHWLSILGLALSQLIRNPPWLKDLLRPVRVALGPVAILNAIVVPVAHVGRVFGQSNTAWQIVAHSPLLLICIACAVSSFAAGVILRPDNTELLHYFLSLAGSDMPKYNPRKNLHAACNMATVFCAGVVLLVECVQQYQVVMAFTAEEVCSILNKTYHSAISFDANSMSLSNIV